MEGGAYQMQEGMATGFGLIFWLIVIGTYLFFAWCHFKIANKAGCESTAWMAFVPLLNVLLMCHTAQKPAWWFFFILVPVVNAIVLAYLWAETAKNIGQTPMWGWLSLVPGVYLLTLLVLAFSDGSPSQPQPPQRQPQPRQPAGVA